MADETEIHAGEAVPPEGTPPPSPGPSAEPPAAETSPVGSAPAADSETLVRADAEPTLLEGIKGDAVNGETKAEAEKVPVEAAAKAETEKSEAEKADAAKVDEKKAAEEKAAAEKAESKKKPEETEKASLEPVEYKYALPETLKMDDALRADVHAAFDAFRADPANPQALIDIHNREMTRFAAESDRNQHKVFSETRAAWRQQIKDDPEIGGENYDKAIASIARMRDMFGSSAKPGTPEYEQDLQAFDGMLRVTGVGDHPVFFKTLYNVAKFLATPAAPSGEIGAPPDIGRGDKRKILYDHPRSNVNRHQ